MNLQPAMREPARALPPERPEPVSRAAILPAAREIAITHDGETDRRRRAGGRQPHHP
jgi:hypothetical protein